MIDVNAVNNTIRQKRVGYAVIIIPAALLIIINIMRVTIPSDIAATAQWYGDSFRSTVAGDEVTNQFVSFFGSTQYPIEGTTLGFMLTVGIIVIMYAYAQAGPWVKGKEITWISAVWGIATKQYDSASINSSKLILFLMGIGVILLDNHTDVIAKTIFDVNGKWLPQYLSASVKLYIANSILSEILLMISISVLIGACANLFEFLEIKATKMTTGRGGTRNPRSKPKNRGHQKPQGARPASQRPHQAPASQPRTLGAGARGHMDDIDHMFDEGGDRNEQPHT